MFRYFQILSLSMLLSFVGTAPCQARTFELLAIGDVTLAGRILEEPKPEHLFSEGAHDRIASADAFLWNCETSGPAAFSKPNKYIFHADGSLFSEFSFQNGAAVTANNHVFDGYQEGAGNLIALLEAQQIRQNGLYNVLDEYRPLRLTQPPDPPMYLLVGTPMSQIGSGPEILTLNYPRLREEIRRLRLSEPDSIIVVYAHDGIEQQPAPTKRQRDWADQFARSGADIILFSHNHQYGDIETLEATPRHTLVAWSLGNFLFGGNLKWKNHPDVRILSIRIDADSGSKSAEWIYGRASNWMFSICDDPGSFQAVR